MNPFRSKTATSFKNRPSPGRLAQREKKRCFSCFSARSARIQVPVGFVGGPKAPTFKLSLFQFG